MGDGGEPWGRHEGLGRILDHGLTAVLLGRVGGRVGGKSIVRRAGEVVMLVVCSTGCALDVVPWVYYISLPLSSERQRRGREYGGRARRVYGRGRARHIYGRVLVRDTRVSGVISGVVVWGGNTRRVGRERGYASK